MLKKQKPRKRILRIMSRVSEVSPNLLIKKTKFAPRTISRHLAVLVEQGIITKKGQRPKVVYSLKQTLSV